MYHGHYLNYGYEQIYGLALLSQITGNNDYLDAAKLGAGHELFYQKEDGSFPDEMGGTGTLGIHYGSVKILAYAKLYDITGDAAYKDAIVDYVDWLLAQKNPDNSFGGTDLVRSTTWAAKALLEAYRITGNTDYLIAANNAVSWLLADGHGYDPSTGAVARYDESTDVYIAYSQTPFALTMAETSSLTIVLATDNGEGIYTMHYTIQNGADGPQTIPVTAADEVGNSETDESLSVTVDTTEPEAAINAPGSGDYIAGSVDIIGTATDTNFESYVVEYCMEGDCTEIGPGTAPVSSGTLTSWDTTEVSDGAYDLKLTVNDLAGNSKVAEIGVNVDNTAPETILSVSEADGLDGWYVTEPTITLSCSDEGSGCDSIYYKILDDFIEYTEPFALSDGITALSYYSADEVGNEEAVNEQEFRVDTVMPTITDDYALSGIWTDSDQSVTLDPGDATSGVKEVRYCEGSACDPESGTVLTSPYQLSYTTDQNTIVRYQAWDTAGNPSAVGEYNVRLDKTAPTSAVTSPESVISEAAQTEVEFTVSWSGDDGPGIGIASYSIQVKQDGQEWEDLLTETTSVETSYEGTIGHEYCFRSKAVDELGNEGSYPAGVDTCTDVVAYQFDISLDKKWNLFSSPVVPMDRDDVAKILSGISDSMDNSKNVWAYDPTSEYAVDGWLTYNPESPEASSLQEMTAGYGYWIYMDEEDTLTIEGTVIPVGGGAMPPSRNLKANSWNMIGIYGVEDKLVSNALSSLYTQEGGQMWSVPMYYYENGGFHGISSDSAAMEAGKGYWIHLKSGAVGEVSYAGGDVETDEELDITYCHSCGDCEDKLYLASLGDIVKLDTDILNEGGSCINWNNNEVVFDCQGHVIDGQGGLASYGISMSGKSGNTIKNCVITDFTTGIYVRDASSDNLVVNNTVNSNSYGVRIDDSSDNTVTGNTMNENSYDGVYLSGSSDNSISGNTANLNGESGIHLQSSSENDVTGNTANLNELEGVYLESSSENFISGNTANLNSYDGIGIYFSSNDNHIVENTACSNAVNDIYISDSTGNTLVGNICLNGYACAFACQV